MYCKLDTVLSRCTPHMHTAWCILYSNILWHLNMSEVMPSNCNSILCEVELCQSCSFEVELVTCEDN